jgi:5-methylcytosine-specific restriction protein A
MFQTGKLYTKNDIYELLNVPFGKRKGAWDTGYHEYNNEIYLFVNVGIEGRTGHNYKNYWQGDLLFWQAKRNSRINQPLIRKILNNTITKHIFTRDRNDSPFFYEGKGNVVKYFDNVPVEIIWSFDDVERHEKIPEELLSNSFKEGSSQQILVNAFERNPTARRVCIDYYGIKCKICGFDFERFYGKIGKNFIHVHHLIPISEIKNEYIINPINDLIPVCPNCHAMLHKKYPPLTPDELKNILNKNV